MSTYAEEQVRGLLRTAKRALGLSVTFLTRMDGVTQTLEQVDSTVPLLFPQGARLTQDTTFCQAILDGRLPAVIPDVRRFPEAMELPAARFPRLRSYVSAPVRLSDGSLYGTFCAAGLTSDPGLTERDRAMMEVLAQAAAAIIEPGALEARRRADIEARLGPVARGAGPRVVLQPIVDLRSGRRVGAEALARFPAEWGMAPDVVFAQAHEVGLGDRLELLALERAAEHLEAVGGYVAMNVSPGTLLTGQCAALLDRLPSHRVLLELSEHDPVEDYDALAAALERPRRAGMRLAVDDAGAGFSSLRHIVATRPDVIKLDRSIVDGLATDPVLATLVGAVVTFARGSGAAVVAEGIETAADARACRNLGVDMGQGWHFGRPGPPEALAPVGEVTPQVSPGG
ncbi:EAL domain-containing protein [Isoptericola sp. b490]|uniref:sensor domain-containing phosphodiesterase n=1 Tax=Actinotalea lenta TaxID=3064654 RepID=UPI0027137F03|nr:EAL domain-containing protein [Isoptericola sp. b490]MDO8121788.1 EAL domain-containing protein [Isoptericola sp. b490]